MIWQIVSREYSPYSNGHKSTCLTLVLSIRLRNPAAVVIRRNGRPNLP
jgi:hypothetical protein